MLGMRKGLILMALSSPLPSREAYSTGSLVLITAALVILAALGFEYLGGYIPCPLCLQERYAYYTGIPVTFLALVALSAHRPNLSALLFIAVALMFLVNTGLGTYHAGAEWKFWPGPQTCGTIQAIGSPGGGLLDKLDNVKVIKCDEAQWRMFGLSFAGWNAVISLFLSLAAIKAASASRRPL